MREVVMRPFEALFIGGESWNHPTHERLHTFLTLDFTPTHIRYFIRERNVANERPVSQFTYLRQGALERSIKQSVGAVNAIVAEYGHRHVDAAWGIIASLVRQADDALMLEPDTMKMTPEGKWEAVKQFIEDNLHEPLTREDVARTIGVHPNHLSRLVRSFADSSYVAYLNERRLLRSVEWLMKYEMTTHEIGRRCGFQTPSHFCRTFKIHFGQSPQAYRRRMSD